MAKIINVTKSYLPNREKLNRYIDQIYESNILTNFGPLHNELELRLKEYLKVENLILISNGTLAIQIALKVLPQREGVKKVITTPFSFVATTSSVLWEGYDPIFVDINRETLNLDPHELEKCLESNRDVHAILPVHVYGNACDVNKIDELSRKYGVPVIYDGAHAFGAKLYGYSLLNHGELTTLSFHATKIFHTIEGGAIIAKNRETIAEIKKLINFGITGPDKIECLGINCKMNEFQAAMGLAVLSEMESVFVQRERVYRSYIEGLPGHLLAPKVRINEPNFSYFPILLKSEAKLFSVKSALEKEGFFSRRYFYPSLNHLVFMNGKSQTPVCDDISKRVLCLPMFSDLSDDSIKTICQIVRGNEN